MDRLFRWTFRIVSGALLLAGLTMLVVYWLAGRSLPEYDATEEVTGISAPVEIVRNTHNVLVQIFDAPVIHNCTTSLRIFIRLDDGVKEKC